MTDTDNVKASDLNAIDILNGDGQVAPNDIYAGGLAFFKGALSPEKIKGYQGDYSNINQNEALSPVSFSANAKFWFWSYLYNLISSSMELIEYEGLPDELDKYSIEYLLRWNGIVGIIKIKKVGWRVVNILPEIGNQYNLGRLPTYVYIAQNDELYQVLPKRKLRVGQDIYVIRHNLQQLNVYMMVRRYLGELNNILTYFEKNNLVSLPKGAVFGSVANSDEIAKNWESFIHSNATISTYRGDTSYINSLRNAGFKLPYFPILFEDKTNQLVQNFLFIKDQIKEMLGFDTIQLQGKKERVLNNELSASSSLSSYNLKHMINIRNQDFKAMKKAGWNIKVKKVVDESEMNQLVNSQNKGNDNG